MEEGTFGGKMELLKLSRLKLQLGALIAEVRDLRERERSTTEQLHLSIQKQKQSEEEFERKLKDLESELASSIELGQKLERKVNYLQNDNALLENKQKELNNTIQSLLQSREHFVNAYQDSTCELIRTLETRDRKLKVFAEKLKSHMLLFDSIEKEALSVKQVVDNVRHVVNEKEEVVTCLKRKFERVSEVEKVFIGKISAMESVLQNYKDEFQRKDKLILELEAKLEAEKNSNNRQEQMEELQKALSTKEAVIQNLISENQALDSEVKSLGAILENIQHAFRYMNKGKKAFPSRLESEERCYMIPGEEIDRIGDSKVNVIKDSESPPALGGSAQRTAQSPYNLRDTYPLSGIPEKNDKEFHVEEPACSTTQSGPQSNTNAKTVSINEVKSKCTTTAWQLESESSTTQAEISEHPG